MDRKYSDPNIWDNSIDCDDAPDGSDGGYTKNGYYILPPAMRELVRLRAELAKANALLLTYGWHRDECAFLEVCDDCDCGFESLLREALTINKAARKGEGE